MAVRNAKAAQTQTFVQGNIAYRTNTVPQERDLAKRRREEERRRQEEQAREEERRRQYRTRREQERALSYSRTYVVFLTVCLILMFGVCSCFLFLQSAMTTHLNNIASVESQIIDLRAENDETYQRLQSSIDIDTIKDRAMSELGMTYPASNQIIYYSVNESDTMTQYAEVP